MSRRSRDERGIALPSPVAAVSLAAVLLAGGAFVATTGGGEDPAEAAAAAASTPVATPVATPAPSRTAPKPVLEEKKKPPRQKPAARRGEVYVEVYNNSGITGLAGQDRGDRLGCRLAGGRLRQLVRHDPGHHRLLPRASESAARMLARDLGIKRLKPAISPMRFDRLTVILTADYA